MDVVLYTDYQSQTIKDTKGNVSPLKGLPKSNVLKYNLSDEKTYFIVRPSGTERKSSCISAHSQKALKQPKRLSKKFLKIAKNNLDYKPKCFLKEKGISDCRQNRYGFVYFVLGCLRFNLNL